MEDILATLTSAQELVSERRFKEASVAYSEALDASVALLGEDHFMTCDVLVHLGNTQVHMQDFEGGKALLVKALGVLENKDPAPPLIQLAAIRMSLAGIYREMGDTAKANEAEADAMQQARSAEEKRRESAALRAAEEEQSQEDDSGDEEDDDDVENKEDEIGESEEGSEVESGGEELGDGGVGGTEGKDGHVTQGDETVGNPRRK